MENLSTKRDKIIKSLFQNELSNIQEELDAIKEAGTNPENVCSQINWDAKDLEGKTKEEVDIINSIRKFIQDLFNEYQIRSTAILAKKIYNFFNDYFNQYIYDFYKVIDSELDKKHEYDM